MIFRSFRVDGFGIWRDLTLSDLQPGLNVLVAPNEGGKTTLMSFARAVLYGFRRRNHPERYEPLRGGKHGGFLEVSDHRTSYRIVRTDDQSSSGALQVTDAVGAPLPEATLARLLGGATRELYENVFAFGLAELQQIETMRNDEVVAHIYSAGMAAAGTNPLGFRDSLEAARRECFLPRGSRQRVAKVLKSIGKLQRQIEPLQQLPDEHERLLEQDQALRARLAVLDADLARRESQLDAARRARSAWGDYEELLATKSALAARGVSLDSLAGTEVADLLSERAAAILAEAGRIRSTLASVPRLRELRAAVDKHVGDAGSAQAAIDSHLNDLGEKWNVDRILTIDAGLERREAAREFARGLGALQVAVDNVSTRVADAHDARNAVAARPDPISLVAVLFTWALAGAATFFSTFAPVAARTIVGAAVASIGFVAGTLVFWLRRRGTRQLHKERVAATEREASLESERDIAAAALDKELTRWRRWLREGRLDDDLSIDGTLDLLDRLREAQEVVRQRQAAETNRDRVLKDLSVACGRVNALLADIGHDPVGFEDNVSEAIEVLIGVLETLQTELDSVEDQDLRLRKEMQHYVQARAALRATSGEEGLEGLSARLETLDPEKIERLVDDAETAVAAVQAQRDGVNEQLGGIAERVSQLERDDELGALIQQRAQARSDLVDAMQTWAEYTTAATLFDRAKKVYEEQRQPEVLRLASGYFKAMTRGAYLRVLAPLGETDLQVEERRSGARKGPEELSRGTKEQLYLAMRLALAAVYANELVTLPLVADDILVNFDDQRAEATAALLGEYADGGIQVLAFTCHERLAEVFAAQAPGASVIKLPPPG